MDGVESAMKYEYVRVAASSVSPNGKSLHEYAAQGYRIVPGTVYKNNQWYYLIMEREIHEAPVYVPPVPCRRRYRS